MCLLSELHYYKSCKKYFELVPLLVVLIKLKKLTIEIVKTCNTIERKWLEKEHGHAHCMCALYKCLMSQN